MTTTQLEQHIHSMLGGLALSDLTKQCLFERMARAAFTTAADDSHTDLVIDETSNGLTVFTQEDCAESCHNR